MVGKPTIDLGRLALWFAWPAVLSEFGPNSPTGEDFDLPLLRLPDVEQPLGTVGEELDRELARIAASHERIGVLLSGGLDSAAVVARLLGVVPVDRVVCVTANLVDDLGQSSAAAAETIARAVHPRLEVAVVDVDPTKPAIWSSAAPRLDAAPAHNDALLGSALEAGCTVALSGNGGDELFGSPRFLMASVLRQGSFRRWLSYAGDSVFYSAEAFWKEPVGLAATLLPGEWRRAAYSRVMWPEELQPPSGAVAVHWHHAIEDWSRSWKAQVVNEQRSLRSWVEFDAWGNLFPMVLPTTPVDIEFQHPLLASRVAAAALARPLALRYDSRHANAYWRTKAPVLSLFDSRTLEKLPTAKQIFNSSLERVQTLGESPLALQELGILDPDIDLSSELDIFRARVFFVERWLTEALERGYEPSIP